MKKFLFLIALVAMLLGAASCSNDMEPALSGDGTVQFKVELPGAIESRAISDGTTAVKLDVACYDADGNYLDIEPTVKTDFVNRVATVTYKLVKGQKYNFAFFAHCEDRTTNPDPYFSRANRYLFEHGEKFEDCKFVFGSLHKTSDFANDEKRDAFYGTLTDYEVTAAETTVTLTRPFAQLNLGTDDLEAAIAAGIEPHNVRVKFSRVSKSFNIATGTASNDDTEAGMFYYYRNEDAEGAMPYKKDPSENLTIDGKEYTWISMNYILVPENEANIDLQVTVHTTDLNTNDDGEDFIINLNNVPFKKNHRTNIVGSLLTADANFNVVIDQNFDTPDYMVPWAFSVSATKQVAFAHGNVQYHTGTGEWRFAANQYDVIGEADNIRLGDPDLSAWVDLFAWSCESAPFGVSPSNKDADYTGNFIDWGTKFTGGWYTPTKDEFQYLLTGRTNAANLRSEGIVNGVNGLILLPDDWTLPEGLTFTPGIIGDWNDVTEQYVIPENIYTAQQWWKMEAAGAVFLPQAGSRTGGYGNMWNGANQATSTNPETGYYSWVDNVQCYGYYWTSTLDPTNSNLVYYLITPGLTADLSEYSVPVFWTRERRRGNSVRLVRSIN